jgi:Zn-dependent M28 family amino/carboxypeptidase
MPSEPPAPISERAIAPTSGSAIAPTKQAAIAPTTFDSNRAWEHLRRQVSFGPRPAGSAALADCRRYLLAELKAAGLTAREQAFTADTPSGAIAMANIIATIPGRRADRIILGSHYDTMPRREFRFVGASDGASSTAALLELGRVLRNRQTEYTIELLFLDGEDAGVQWQGTDHTYGSRHYVQAAKTAGTLGGVKAFVLLDMIGDRNLNIRRETTSTRWLTDIVWAAATRLGYQRYFVSESFTIGGDDHWEFLAANVPSVDIIDFDYPEWHTAQDDLDHVSARSLQVVGDVVLEALPQIEKRLSSTR